MVSHGDSWCLITETTHKLSPVNMRCCLITDKLSLVNMTSYNKHSLIHQAFPPVTFIS